jgi:hypothetical protein
MLPISIYVDLGEWPQYHRGSGSKILFVSGVCQHMGLYLSRSLSCDLEGRGYEQSPQTCLVIPLGSLFAPTETSEAPPVSHSHGEYLLPI